jgi:integration host factor subunit alpha
VDPSPVHKYRSSEFLECLLEIIKKTLESGKDILINGFGEFCVKKKGINHSKLLNFLLY